MAIETLEDITEEVADALGIYGSCQAGEPRSFKPPYCCRSHFVADLNDRIRQAAKIENAVSAQEDQTP